MTKTDLDLIWDILGGTSGGHRHKGDLWGITLRNIWGDIRGGGIWGNLCGKLWANLWGTSGGTLRRTPGGDHPG